MTISAKLVKELRDRTGAGMMDCKKALTETDGDLEQAIEKLRKAGIAKAEKKKERAVKDGSIYAYIHQGNKLGALVEINCETDFVAKTPDFMEFAKDIAMQVAASSPLYVQREEVPEEVIEAERDIYRSQAAQSGKPENVVERIVEGKLDDFFSKVCLLEQTFIKDQKMTISDLLKERIAQTGENLSIRRFTLYRLGEE